MRYPLHEPIADAECADCARPVTFSQGEHLYKQADGRFIGECCVADPENAEPVADCLTPRPSEAEVLAHATALANSGKFCQGYCELCTMYVDMTASERIHESYVDGYRKR